MKLFISLLMLSAHAYMAAAQSDCPQLRCSNPCESPGFRGRDSDGCPSCECTCPVLEECSMIECPAGQVPFTQHRSVNGCDRCLCVEENDKPGICPDIPPSTGGPCLVECTRDSDCSGNQKCCGNCPRQCVSAAAPRVLEKPGRCPNRPIELTGNCEPECDNDDDCTGKLKCCGDCKECMAPATSMSRRKRPTFGQCPPRFQRVRSKCNNNRRRRRNGCDTDADCKNGKICCGSCIRRCVRSKPRNKFITGF